RAIWRRGSACRNRWRTPPARAPMLPRYNGTLVPSEAPLQPDAGQDGQSLERALLRIVVAVERGLGGAAVVRVDHVEVRVQLPGVEGPDFVDAHVELVEERQPAAVGRPEDGQPHVG